MDGLLIARFLETQQQVERIEKKLNQMEKMVKHIHLTLDYVKNCVKAVTAHLDALDEEHEET